MNVDLVKLLINFISINLLIKNLLLSFYYNIYKNKLNSLYNSKYFFIYLWAFFFSFSQEFNFMNIHIIHVYSIHISQVISTRVIYNLKRFFFFFPKSLRKTETKGGKKKEKELRNIIREFLLRNSQHTKLPGK